MCFDGMGKYQIHSSLLFIFLSSLIKFIDYYLLPPLEDECRQTIEAEVDENEQNTMEKITISLFLLLIFTISNQALILSMLFH